MVQRGRGACLLLEAPDRGRTRTGIDVQHFDRDAAPELRVVCAIHLAHAADAQEVDDLVRADARTRPERHAGIFDQRARETSCKVCWLVPGPTGAHVPAADGADQAVIAVGDWLRGHELPSIRELAVDVGVRVTIAKRAYWSSSEAESSCCSGRLLASERDHGIDV